MRGREKEGIDDRRREIPSPGCEAGSAVQTRTERARRRSVCVSNRLSPLLLFLW